MLVTKRGQLKGLSHKEELAQTKEEIQVSVTDKIQICFIESIQGFEDFNEASWPTVAGVT